MTNSICGRLAGIAGDQYGIFTRRQAMAHGYTDRQIQRLRDRGEWYRIRDGVYMERRLWDALDWRERHLTEARAALCRVKNQAVVSHWSAALAWNYDLYEPDLSEVHLTRPRRWAARHEAGLAHHVGRLEPDEVTERDGLPLTSPARTVVDIACRAGYEPGLVVADSALRNGLDRETLREQFLSQSSHQGALLAGRAVTRADGRADSPGETRCRVLFEEQNIPEPVLQHPFLDSTGHEFARADFWWPEYATVGEFDGKRKYYRDLRDDERPGDVVWREKKREDRLRQEFGVEIVRFIWFDLYPANRRLTAERTWDTFARGARRRSA